MIFQEKYELDYKSAEFFGDKFDLIIMGGERASTDCRTLRVRKTLKLFKGRILYLWTDVKAEVLKYELTDLAGNIISSEYDSRLIPDLRKLLRTLSIDQLTVCIDITCLQQAIIFLLTRLLVNDISPKDFFAAYTEPEEYIPRKQVEESEEGEEYELYEEIKGLNYTVPGFSKISRKNQTLLVASLGFEKQRLISIFEYIEPTDGIIPVLGFPAFTPGMNLTALFMNYKVLHDSSSEGIIEMCEASSPFAFYNVLEEIARKKEEQQEVLVAPLGTRPHCLGAALFVAKHKDFQLIYDFPVEKKYRSSGAMKSNIYFLSNYLI